MYMGGAHQNRGMGGLSRRRYTKCVEHNWKGRLHEQEKARRPEGGLQWRGAVCYGAKNANGRQTTDRPCSIWPPRVL
jgi:hypothetical protein